MSKSKPLVNIKSAGIYNQWDSDDKSLPKIQKFTNQVEATVDVEFGFIVNIKKAKGEKIHYCIYHPYITDDDGKLLSPFDGFEYVGSNNWDFYLGDTIWLPIENKLGEWRMTIELNGKIIADKTFELIEEGPAREDGFWY